MRGATLVRRTPQPLCTNSWTEISASTSYVERVQVVTVNTNLLNGIDLPVFRIKILQVFLFKTLYLFYFHTHHFYDCVMAQEVIAGPSLRRPVFNIRPIHVGFVAVKVAVGHDVLGIFGSAL